jgi:4-aminobutyrate aminotransferase and related aminotransferases
MNPEACGDRCLDEMERLFQYQVPPEEVCAMIVEPFLGEGGYYPAPRSYLNGLRRICDRYGILLIFDEVQSGVGRTGRWFCCEHAGVRPDIVIVANAVASGFPLGVVLAPAELMRRWGAPYYGSTFGGNPVSCAASLATIRAIREEGLLEASRVAGSRMLASLQELAMENPRIGEVRGMGCMIGVEFVDEAGAADGRLCQELIEKCLEKGLILIGCGLKRNVVRLVPPLNVTDVELGEGMAIFADALHELSGKVRR